MNAATYVCPMTLIERYRAALKLYRANFGKFLLIYAGLIFFSSIFGGIGYYFNNVLGIRQSTVLLIDLVFYPTILLASTAAAIATSNAILQRPVKAAAAWKRAFSHRVLLCILLSYLPLWAWALFYSIYTDAYFRPAGIQLDPSVSLMLAPMPVKALYFVNSFLPSFYSIFILFVPPVAILERGSVAKRIQRAISLFLGNLGRVIVNYGLAVLLTITAMMVFFTCSLLSLGIFLVLTNPGSQSLTPGTTVSIYVLVAVVFTISFLIILPLTNLVVLLLYYDIRARKENYTQEALAEEMGYRPMAEMIRT